MVYYGPIEREDEEHWVRRFRDEDGIEFRWIDPEADANRHFRGLNGSAAERGSLRVARELSTREADVYFFQDLRGLGYRAMEMKRMGVAFRRSLLTCMVHSSHEWISEAMNSLMVRGADEMVTRAMERQSVRWCDVLLSPSRYMLDWSQRDAGIEHARARAIPYVFETSDEPISVHEPVRAILFFGRLEQRKGLLVFLEAIDRIRRNRSEPLEIVLLGRIGMTEDGHADTTIARYRERFGETVRIEELTDKGHDEAISILQSRPDALVVCPSLLDNMPYAIIEAICLNCNLITSNTGGIPELTGDETRVFAPEAGALAAVIERALAGELGPPRPAYQADAVKAEWTKWLDELAVEVGAMGEVAPSAVTELPLVVSAAHPDQEAVKRAAGGRRIVVAGGEDVDDVIGRALVVPNGVVPDADGLHELERASADSGADVVMGLTRWRDEDGREIEVGPVVPSAELIGFGNLAGWGCAVGGRDFVESMRRGKFESAAAGRAVLEVARRGGSVGTTPVVVESALSMPRGHWGVYDRPSLEGALDAAGVVDLSERRMAVAIAGTMMDCEEHLERSKVWVKKQLKANEVWWQKHLKESEVWWKEKVDFWWKDAEAKNLQVNDLSAKLEQMRERVVFLRAHQSKVKRWVTDLKAKFRK